MNRITTFSSSIDRRAFDSLKPPASLRRGFTLIETMLGCAFLVVATGLAVRVHQARSQFDRASLNRLSDSLLVENAGQRLSLIPDDELADAAERLSEELNLQIDVQSFELDGRKGQHLIVKTNSEANSAFHHAWRLEASP
ncbi:hypothetical protein LOC71_02520 [Rhodopirellula sp. JC740]|uniref:Prepilin-type N-terminal cleavage/methylation domain-containing protein n=1 Tax=Rhodopirellula halodulae TaxID=2894198 RepID=A0ABS8NC48_9BACT|nr:hypothetical protein [Rhodopirellula sp. JC740]MCC9641131.1 hypothetical protein [Rhodopirellula sp. JC740]